MLSISMLTQNLVKFHQFILKILSGNQILTSIEGYNSEKSIINLRQLTLNKPNLDLVSINEYAKFGQIQTICFQDTIKWKRSIRTESWHDRQPENSKVL